MKLSNYYFLSFLFSLSVTFANPGKSLATEEDTCKILLLGSSYFEYNNPTLLVKKIAEAADKNVEIEKHTGYAYYLETHSKAASTEAKIKEKRWDYIILQGVGRITAYPSIFTDHPVLPAIQLLSEKIHANSPETKVVFCLPWAYEDGMAWKEGWTDTFDDMQRAIYKNTLEYSAQVGFTIAPVGWAWKKALEEKGFPLHYLHVADSNHPSYKGSYLMSAVIYSTIFGERCEEANYKGALNEEDALFLRRVASDIVADSLDLWNVTDVNMEEEKTSLPEEHQILYNYPNPFNPTTNILFDIQEAGHATLRIYNTLGERVAELLNEKVDEGRYTKEWNGSGCPSGIYICSLQCNKLTQNIKIVLLK